MATAGYSGTPLVKKLGFKPGMTAAFLDAPGTPDSIVSRVREAVRRCAGHPAVFCYAVGNEIPASIVFSSSPRVVDAEASAFATGWYRLPAIHRKW